MTDYRLVIMGLCGLLCLCSIDGALASESEMLDLQIQLLDQEMMALRRHQAALSQSLALPRESPRVGVLDALPVAPPPMDMRTYEPLTEEPRQSMRPPWLQPADRMAPMTPDESRRMFCVAPDDCWFDRQ